MVSAIFEASEITGTQPLPPILRSMVVHRSAPDYNSPFVTILSSFCAFTFKIIIYFLKYVRSVVASVNVILLLFLVIMMLIFLVAKIA